MGPATLLLDRKLEEVIIAHIDLLFHIIFYLSPVVQGNKNSIQFFSENITF